MRITTLTMSDAPSTASETSATMKLPDSANTIVESPKHATAANISFPALPSIGQRVSASAIASAPAPGAARNRPSAQGPASKTSRANTGSSAATPPTSTEKKKKEEE